MAVTSRLAGSAERASQPKVTDTADRLRRRCWKFDENEMWMDLEEEVRFRVQSVKFHPVPTRMEMQVHYNFGFHVLLSYLCLMLLFNQSCKRQGIEFARDPCAWRCRCALRDQGSMTHNGTIPGLMGWKTPT